MRCPFFCFPSLDSSYLLLLFLTVFSFSISTAFPFSFFSRTIGSLLVFLVVVVVVVDGRCNFAAVSAFLRENCFFDFLAFLPLSLESASRQVETKVL